MSARIIKIATRNTEFFPVVNYRPALVAGFKIESGIPISEPSLGRPKSPLRQAIEALKVGESFQVTRTEFSSGHI